MKRFALIALLLCAGGCGYSWDEGRGWHRNDPQESKEVDQ
jgi:hypothetical protein